MSPAAAKRTGGSFVPQGALTLMNKWAGAIARGVRAKEPHKIDFTTEGNGWRKGATEIWYADQLKYSTRFEYLEYRREQLPPFYHEFVVVELGNDTVCRFDRRGNPDSRANILVGKSIPSEDTAHVIAKNDKSFYPQIAASDLVLRMHFPKGEDILTILAICFGIQSTKATKSYSLTRYNDSFFSWMIVIGIARLCADWGSRVDDDSLWEKLITPIDPEHLRSGLSNQSKSSIFRIPTLGKASHQMALSPLIGSALLYDHLKTKLRNDAKAREEIHTSLRKQLWFSKVESAMQLLLRKIVSEATRSAAISHAIQIAGDTVTEAMIESIWHNGSGVFEECFWHEQYRIAKECVKNASAVVAELFGLGILDNNPTTSSKSGPPSQWENAWDKSWRECWATTDKTATGLVISDHGEGNEPLQNRVCTRARSAWIVAWGGASRANEDYATLLGSRLADYLNADFPDVLKYETETNTLTKMIKGLNFTTFEGSKNAKLQDWVKGRITDHCERVFRMTAGAQQPSRQEFEETMTEIWERTVSCFPKKPEVK